MKVYGTAVMALITDIQLIRKMCVPFISKGSLKDIAEDIGGVTES